MAKPKPKRPTPAAPAPLPPVDSGPTEDQLQVERIEEKVSKIEAASERLMGRLHNYLLRLTSDNSMCDKLRIANGIWGTYPMWREQACDSPRNIAIGSHIVSTAHSDRVISTTYLALCKLNEVHDAAVDVLMTRAKELGRDPAVIWKSGNYCRTLLEHYQEPPGTYPGMRAGDIWPECLGATLIALPTDIRQSIQDGHAEVLAMCVRVVKLSRPRSKSGWQLLMPEGKRKSDQIWNDLLADAKLQGMAKNPEGKPKSWKSEKSFCDDNFPGCRDFDDNI